MQSRVPRVQKRRDLVDAAIEIGLVVVDC